MTTNNVYTIYDSVAQECGPLFESINDGVAVRHMVQAMRNVENPAEYQLYHVGEVSRENGSVVLLPCSNRVISFTLSPDRSMAVLEGNNEKA